MYQCAIEYTGNGNPLQQALLNDITVNGNIYSSSSLLSNFTSIKTDISDSLDAEAITYSQVFISMANSGNIAANTGSILAHVTIFYPSIEFIDMTLGMSINGANQSILLEKIPTT